MKTERSKEQKSIEEVIMFLDSSKRNIKRYRSESDMFSRVYVLDIIDHSLSILRSARVSTEKEIKRMENAK